MEQEKDQRRKEKKINIFQDISMVFSQFYVYWLWMKLQVINYGYYNLSLH